VVLYGTIAFLVARAVRPWPAKVTAWGLAVSVVVAVAFSRIYLRVHFLTDVLGAMALGAVWLAFTATAFHVLFAPSRRPASTTAPGGTGT